MDKNSANHWHNWLALSPKTAHVPKGWIATEWRVKLRDDGELMVLDRPIEANSSKNID